MGLFFKDYESAGSGISKHAPKKKGISLFFDIVGRKFWKLLELNMLYMLFFMPLVLIIPAISMFADHYKLLLCILLVLLLTFMITIGPATAGMTKVMRCFVIGKHTFMFRDFFSGFKTNFKYASIVGFIDCLIVASAYAALNVYPILAVQFGTKLMYVPMVITFSLFLVVIIMNYYIYLMMTATNLSLKNLIKNSFALAFAAIKQNLLTFVISLVTLILMVVLMLYLLPVFLFVVPFFPATFLCLVTCFNSYPVIQKYVINPYYTSIGQINPELADDSAEDDEERIFEDMGGKEKPIEKRKKGKGKRIS